MRLFQSFTVSKTRCAAPQSSETQERSQVEWLTASLSACWPTCLSISMSACLSVCMDVTSPLSCCLFALCEDVITPALCLQAVLWKRREERSSLMHCRSWRRKTAHWRWLVVSVQSTTCQDVLHQYRRLLICSFLSTSLNSCLQNHGMEMNLSLDMTWGQVIWRWLSGKHMPLSLWWNLHFTVWWEWSVKGVRNKQTNSPFLEALRHLHHLQ